MAKSTDIIGKHELFAKFDKLASLELKNAVTTATKLVHAQAVALAPVGDGELRESIHMDVKDTGNEIVGTVSTNVEYAPYVEFGTGIVGNGTFPYQIEGVNLAYSDKKYWHYQDKSGEWHTTSGQVAKPFLYPAIKIHERTIKKIISDGIKGNLKGEK